MSYQARKNSDGYYNWHPADFLSSPKVARMSLAEQGAYRRLLDHAFLEGGYLSPDRQDLADYLGVDPDDLDDVLTARVRRCFESSEQGLYSPRLLREMGVREEHAGRGKLNSNIRWALERGERERYDELLLERQERFGTPAIRKDGTRVEPQTADSAWGPIGVGNGDPLGSESDPNAPYRTEGKGTEGKGTEESRTSDDGASAPASADAERPPRAKLKQSEFDASEWCPIEVWEEYTRRVPIPPRTAGGWTKQAKALGYLLEQAGEDLQDQALEDWLKWSEDLTKPIAISTKSVNVTLDKLKRSQPAARATRPREPWQVQRDQEMAASSAQSSKAYASLVQAVQAWDALWRALWGCEGEDEFQNALSTLSAPADVQKHLWKIFANGGVTAAREECQRLSQAKNEEAKALVQKAREAVA